MLEIEPGRLLDYKEIPETEETNGIGNIRSTEVYETGKRVFDIFASLLAIIILFLPMLVICLIVYIDDPKEVRYLSSIDAEKMVNYLLFINFVQCV